MREDTPPTGTVRSDKDLALLTSCSITPKLKMLNMMNTISISFWNLEIREVLRGASGGSPWGCIHTLIRTRITQQSSCGGSRSKPKYDWSFLIPEMDTAVRVPYHVDLSTGDTVFLWHDCCGILLDLIVPSPFVTVILPVRWTWWSTSYGWTKALRL